MLEEIGVRLEGAFPIPVALEALPEIGNRPVPVVALLRGGFGAIVFWSTAAGYRNVRVFQSEVNEADINAELTEAFGAIAEKDRLCFLVLDVAATPLVLDGFGVNPKAIKTDDLLLAAETLDAKGLANLLPPSRKIRADLVLYALAGIFLICGLAGWGSYESQLRKNESDIAAQKQEALRIAQDNERFLGNKRQIEKAEAVLGEAIVAPQAKLKFLHALNAARPVAISIRSVEMTERKWVVSGFIHEGWLEPTGPFSTFLKNLAAGKDWDLSAESKATAQKTRDFTITGTFK